MEPLSSASATTNPFQLSFIVFVSTYLFGYFILFRSWPPKRRSEACSSLMSLVHGTPAVIMALRVLSPGASSPRASIASINTPPQTTVLDFSLAYFVADLTHYAFFFPRDVLFILHHAVTLYVILTCRFAVRHGAWGILVILVLAEATSPCQNAWTLAGCRSDDVPVAKRAREILSPVFFAAYTVVRGVMAPVALYEIGSVYVSGEAAGLVPFWAWASWLVVTGVGIALSLVWVLCQIRCWWWRNGGELGALEKAD